MENSARLDVSFAARVLGAAVGKNVSAHDKAMMLLVAWLHAHDTDGIVYGGDKAALDKGFSAWAYASFTDAGFHSQFLSERCELGRKTAVVHGTGCHGVRVHFSL
jgi:hypothetical protein